MPDHKDNPNTIEDVRQVVANLTVDWEQSPTSTTIDEAAAKLQRMQDEAVIAELEAILRTAIQDKPNGENEGRYWFNAVLTRIEALRTKQETDR